MTIGERITEFIKGASPLLRQSIQPNQVSSKTARPQTLFPQSCSLPSALPLAVGYNRSGRTAPASPSAPPHAATRFRQRPRLPQYLCAHPSHLRAVGLPWSLAHFLYFVPVTVRAVDFIGRRLGELGHNLSLLRFIPRVPYFKTTRFQPAFRVAPWNSAVSSSSIQTMSPRARPVRSSSSEGCLGE